jgi:hypothetical protein
VFDKDVGKDLSFWTKPLAVAEGIVGITFDKALIGKHCAGVHIDADEASVAGGTKGESSTGVVAKDVEANGQFHCGANGAAGGSHGSHRFGSDICFCERNIAKIFDEERMSAAAFIGVGVGDGSRDYFFQVTLPARRAGERLEVDDTNENSLTFVEQRGQRVKWVK